MEFPLSDFCIIKLSFFDSDFNDTNSSLVKWEAALFLLYELKDESALSLILAFRSCFFWPGKSRKLEKTTAVKDHMLFCEHIVSLDDCKILTSSNSEFHLKIKESLLISRDKPELNRNEKSLPLCLFD